MNKELVELGVTDAALAELKAEWATVPDCSTRAGYNLATTGIADIRKKRGQVEKRRKELKKPIIERGKLIEVEAKRITAALVAIETPLKDAKQAEDNRLEMIRVEEERKEAARQQRITDKISGFTAMLAKGAGASSHALGEMLDSLREVDNSDCDERKEQADAMLSETVNGLTKLREQAEQAEEYQRRQKELAEEQARQEAERAKLEQEKAEMETNKAKEEKAKQAREEALKKAAEEKESPFKDAPGDFGSSGGFGRGPAFGMDGSSLGGLGSTIIDDAPGAVTETADALIKAVSEVEPVIGEQEEPKVNEARRKEAISAIVKGLDTEDGEEIAEFIVNTAIADKFKWIKWVG